MEPFKQLYEHVHLESGKINPHEDNRPYQRIDGKAEPTLDLTYYLGIPVL